ncbi:MAG: ABC transporter permease [Deltaproteobacteria bacterium]|nr:ABC transporter permease [Deltaproteobacteria bacterium]
MQRPQRAASETVIEASRGWRGFGFGELWGARELIWVLCGRELKSKYRQMAIGPLWILLRPALSTLVFTVVFGGLAKLPSQGIPYPLYALAGLLPWTFFLEAARAASGSLADRLDVISKVHLPRMVLPVVAVLSAAVDFVGSLVLLAIVMAVYRVVPGASVLLLPAVLLFTAAVALAVGLWLATFSVRFRDLRFGVAYALFGLMFLTPVAYSPEVIPPAWLWLYQLNPAYWMVEGFRYAVLGVGSTPGLACVAALAATALLLLSGAAVFRRTEASIVDQA